MPGSGAGLTPALRGRQIKAEYAGGEHAGLHASPFFFFFFSPPLCLALLSASLVLLSHLLLSHFSCAFYLCLLLWEAQLLSVI